MNLSFLLHGGMAGLFALGCVSSLQAESWSPVYAPDSTPDQILRFKEAAGYVRTPAFSNTSSFYDGITTDSTTPGTTLAGSWELEARGRAVRTSDGAEMASVYSATAVNSDALEFSFSVDNWSSLDGLSMVSLWSGSTVIDGSESWTALGSKFRYSFDVNLDGNLLDFSATYYSDFTLTIQTGADVLYEGSLSEIFSTLQGGLNSGSVEFDYTGSAPLTITWDGSAVIDEDLLNYLWPNDVLAFSVSNGEIQVEAIPEPGTYALLGGSLVMFGVYRMTRRKQSESLC